MMGKISIHELSVVLTERNDLSKKEATTFVSAMFDVIQEELETDKVVKIKGLGTFKIIDVDDRESVNVNTGERVLIEGHGKITFTPDPLMKELVNKPFSQFETVVLNDGVEFEDVPSDSYPDETAIPEQETEMAIIPELKPQIHQEEQAAMPLVDFVDDSQETEDIPEWVIEPEVIPEKEQETVVIPVKKDEPEVVIEVKDEPEIKEEVSAVESEDVPVEETEDSSLEDEDDEEFDAPSGGRKWLIALLACLLGLIGGYVVGSYFPMSDYLYPGKAEAEVPAPVKKPVTPPVKKVAPVNEQAPEMEKVEEQAPEASIPEEQTVDAQTSKPNEETVKTDAPQTDDSDKYEAMDQRVRFGAYRIIGTAEVVTVKEGDNLVKIARRKLGPDMECYLEVYNGLKASSELKVGQEIKIPKLQIKKKRKTQTVNR